MVSFALGDMTFFGAGDGTESVIGFQAKCYLSSEIPTFQTVARSSLAYTAFFWIIGILFATIFFTKEYNTGTIKLSVAYGTKRTILYYTKAITILVVSLITYLIFVATFFVIQSMQQLHEKIADMNSRYYDLRGKIVKAERRIAILTERGEMWEQYNQYKSIHKQLAKVKPEKREQFEQRHSRELILYDAATRYLKDLKDNGEAITPKAWQREIDQLTAGKQTDSIDMKAMREELKAVERLRKAADQLARQERDKPRDRGPER